MVNILALILQFHAFHSFSSRLVVSVFPWFCGTVDPSSPHY